MSWPATLYVSTKDERVITITGAKYRAREEETDWYPGTEYRDDPVALLNVPGSGDTIGMTVGDGGVTVYAGRETAIDPLATETTTPAAYASDLVTHTAPRQLKRKTSYFRWYDSPPLTRSVTTTNGSTTVTMSSTTGLIVGMGLSGAGIPAGSTIVSITNGTDFVISQPATASATVTGSFTGNMVGEVEMSNYADASGNMPAYMA